MSKITLNIVEPGSPTPIDPGTGTDTIVPNTGLFTHGIGGPEATIITITSAVLLLTIVAIVLAVLYKKHKAQGKVTKLVHVVDSCRAVITSRKRIAASLTAVTLLVSAGTFIALAKNSVNATDADEESEGGTGLTVDVSSEELTIEVGDEPVFAVLPVEVSVEEATAAGYTLTAYTDSTDLVSTTDESNTIPMIAVEGDELEALTDNTYGLALGEEPTSKDSEVYTSLSTDSSNPTIIKSMTDYTPTEANDTTTIYYGFYITPDIPYGTYTGAEVDYAAKANRTDLAKVTFDGNGLFFDGDENKTTNIVRYEKTITDRTEAYSHTPNINDEGEQTPGEKYPIGLNRTFVYEFADAAEVDVNVTKIDSDSYYSSDDEHYFSFWPGNHPDYTALSNWSSGVKVQNSNGKYIFESFRERTPIATSLEGNTVTFAYTTGDKRGSSDDWRTGYGYYAIITAQDAEGNPAHVVNNALCTGEYKIPATTTVGDYRFLGWSTDPDGTYPMYTTADEIAAGLVLEKGDDTTLYAVWSPVVDVNYDGNNATAGSMESTVYSDNEDPTRVTLAHENVIAGDVLSLYAPNYRKEGYGFAGWSADSNAWNDLTDEDESNNPVIYGPNQSVTLTKDMAFSTDNENITLYAVWVPAEKDASGNPVALQNWNECSTLTSTIYNATTGTLETGKNTVTALTDNRDGNVYAVARLADGNCWMIENLRLDNTTEISTANTNNPHTVSGNVSIKNNNGSTSKYLSPSSSTWCTNYYDQYEEGCYNQSYLNTFNTNLGGQGAIASHNGSTSSEKPFQWYSYGNYYNWYSATAGNGTFSVASGNVSGDICPIGWKIPIGGQSSANGSFSKLDIDMGGSGGYQIDDEGKVASSKWRSFPNNLTYSGYWYDTYGASRGVKGEYWSSTASDSRHDSAIIISRGLMTTRNSSTKSYGHTVRCIMTAE